MSDNFLPDNLLPTPENLLPTPENLVPTPSNVLPSMPDNIIPTLPTNIFGSVNTGPMSGTKMIVFSVGGIILLLVAGGLAMFALNSLNKNVGDVVVPPPVQTPVSNPVGNTPPAQPTGQNCTKTFANDAYKDFGFSYDSCVWTLKENGSDVLLSLTASPQKQMVVSLSKDAYSQYTGNIAYLCGRNTALLKAGTLTSPAPIGDGELYKSGLMRVMVDSGFGTGRHYYGQNYFGNSATGETCVDNYGTTAVLSNQDMSGKVPQGDLIRATVFLEKLTSGEWSASELLSADAVVKTMTMK